MHTHTKTSLNWTLLLNSSCVSSGQQQSKAPLVVSRVRKEERLREKLLALMYSKAGGGWVGVEREEELSLLAFQLTVRDRGEGGCGTIEREKNRN